VQALTKGEVPVNYFRWKGMPVLSLAAARGRIGFVKSLLERGADVDLRDTEGRIAMDYAQQHQEKEVEKLLLRAALGQTFLSSVRSGDLEKVKASLVGNVDPNTRDTNGVSALMHASYGGHTRIAKLLIDSGAVVDATGPHGATALGLAKNAEVAQVLLDNGASLNLKTTNSFNPLVSAVAAGNAETVKLLLDRGAAPDLVVADGATALNQAAARDRAAIVSMLLAKGASIDLTNQHGRTALAIAAREGSTNSVRLLLERGANRAIRDEQGMTAADYARRKPHSGIVEMLTERIDLAPSGNPHGGAP